MGTHAVVDVSVQGTGEVDPFGVRKSAWIVGGCDLRRGERGVSDERKMLLRKSDSLQNQA